MNRTISEARKKAFLKALAESGSLDLSAEKAKVSRSWALRLRKRDAAFASAYREAVAHAKARLSKLQPPKGWSFLSGAELVVGGSNGRHTQVRRARVRQWTPRTERRFLDALATTCNVKAACAEIGLTMTAAYNHRRRWPAFAKAWDEAIETGYTHLETELVLAGCNLFSDHQPAVPSQLSGMTAAEAVHLLHMHKFKVHGIGKGPHPQLRSPLPEATARLRKVLVAVARDNLRKGVGSREWAESVIRDFG